MIKPKGLLLIIKFKKNRIINNKCFKLKLKALFWSFSKSGTGKNCGLCGALYERESLSFDKNVEGILITAWPL